MTTLNDIQHFSITSLKGKQEYYFPLEYYYYKEFGDSIPIKRKLPSRENTIEYMNLLNDNRKANRREQRKERLRLREFEKLYDWRDIVTTSPDGPQGLKSPDGKILLPEIFQTVLGQTMSMKYGIELVPVSNGEGLGLVYPSENPLMLTPFIYKDIILERWEHEFYFVQSKETGKGGTLKFKRIHSAPRKPMKLGKRARILSEVLPVEYNEIYEDEICTDCSPTLFWVFRKGDKLGILTPYHCSEAVYDGYDTDWEECSFTLFRNGKKTVFNYHRF